MVRIQKSFFAVMMAVLVGLFTLAPMSAQHAEAAQPTSPAEIERENSDINKMFHKLGRGIVNIFTGWLEIPKQTAKEWRRYDPFTGTVLGLIKGVWMAFARTAAGFYEVISFPFPVPRNYEPIMEPEFVLPTIWGERLPLFRDEFTGSSGAIDNAIDYGTDSPTAYDGGRNY